MDENIPTIDDIMSWDLRRLYLELKRIINDSTNARETLEEVKTGLKLKIPIVYIIQDWYELLPQYQSARVRFFGRYDLMLFMNEIEAREDLMRETLIEHYSDTEQYIPRNE